MENLNSKSSEDIGDAIIIRFANLSYSNQPAETSVGAGGVDVETKIIESSDPQTLSNCDMLFTPSSKCPKAFIKERVVLSPDDPSWVLRKMNFDYDQKVTKISAMKENPHSEEDFDSQATTSEGEFDSQTITSLDTVDTVSHSTYLAPYMAKNADKLVSETLSQDESDETTISSNSQLGDVTVISVTSDDEGSGKNVANHPNPDENVLKDSSNAFIISNESQSTSKHGINRSRSFTLECPSPLLMDALQKNLIGLEPNLDDNTTLSDATDMASNISKPRARVPVSRSLMFSAVEKKETVDEKVSKKDDTKSTTERKTANLKAYRRLEIKNDISMPVLDIRKLCNESGRYFEPVSLSSDNYSFSQLYQSSANQLSSIASSDLENSESEIPKDRETEIIVGQEETDHPASDSSSKEAEDETMGQFLKQKQESFKQFLDDFSLKDKDLSRTFSVPPKLPMDLEKVEEPMCPLSMLEAQEVRFQEEMNKIREELKVHSHSLQEIKFLKQKVQKQDQTILELKNQLKMQQQKQTDWMEYIFDIQTVKLERLVQQKMEDFKRQFLKEKEEEVSISTVSDNEFEDFDGPPEPEHTTQSIPVPMNYNSSNSSTSSVMTVVKAAKSAINEDTSTIRQFFMSKQAPSLEIITPPRALDPDMKPKFDKISAIVKGFLTRCLMKTHKVQGIIKTIKDTMSTALQIHADLDVYPPKSRTILSQDVQLSKRLLNQLNSACHEFSNIFFGYTIKEQMALIAQSRELRLNPRPKPEFRKISITKRHPRARSLTPQIRNNSSLSKYQRKKNEYSPTNLHSNRIKRTSNSASPRLLNRRVCRSSTGNVTLQPPKGVSILPSYLIETPKKEPKLFTFDNRSPSFLN